MLIEQNIKFNPVKITIETRDEWMVLLTAVMGCKATDVKNELQRSILRNMWSQFAVRVQK